MKDIRKFKCLQCGNCCRWNGYVRLTESEPDKIAGFLGVEVRQFIDTFTKLTSDRRCLSLVENDDGSCIFYSITTGKCIINDVKPKQCSDFPLVWNFPAWEEVCAWAKKR